MQWMDAPGFDEVVLVGASPPTPRGAPRYRHQMADINQLAARLDALQAALPRMIEDNPDPADFWPVFIDEADAIEGQAAEHCTFVSARLAAMLAEHGRYVSFADMDEDPQ